MNSKPLNLPPSLTLFQTLKPPHKTLVFHQISIVLVAFIAYASFHASRKPPSIQLNSTVTHSNSNSILSNSSVMGWALFNGSRGTHRLWNDGLFVDNLWRGNFKPGEEDDDDDTIGACASITAFIAVRAFVVPGRLRTPPPKKIISDGI